MSTDLTQPIPAATEMSWQAPPDLSFEDYVETGRTIASMSRVAQFWLGDWVNYGEHAYGEKFAQAIEITGYDYGTLRNFASVAGQIEPSRRRDSVPFGHHQAVTSIKDQRLQDQLLERAATEGYTLEKMRAEARAVRLALAPPAPDDPEPDPQWSEPPGYERAVEQVRSAMRALAAMLDPTPEQIGAAWADGADVTVMVDGVVM